MYHKMLIFKVLYIISFNFYHYYSNSYLFPFYDLNLTFTFSFETISGIRLGFQEDHHL